MNKKHLVKKGDSLWKISKDYKVPLLEIRNLNPHVKGDLIYPGDVLKLEPNYKDVIVNVRQEREREQGLSNIGAIQNYNHNSNYIIIDKQNNKFSIFDRNNKLLYLTDDISTGKSKNDYNTITYVDNKGVIRNNAGNNSTPAGISIITGTGKYHGYNSFTRGRYNNNGTVEDIASSIHYGPTADKKASNGCVRAGGKCLQDIGKLIGVSTPVYTLPEREGSKFVLRNGKLNFVADNPYGLTLGDKKYWDDYNVRIDKSYSPLMIYYNGNNTDSTYNGNVLSFVNSISNNKRALQNKFNLSSDEYNRLAELAVGIAEQESKYGTSTRYKTKSILPDFIISSLKFNFKAPRSRGITQIKMEGDNKELRSIYKLLGVNGDNVTDPGKAAIATMSRLAYMYNTEVKGRNFNGVSPYDALLYKYIGRNNELKSKTATPESNKYLKNVKDYSKNFEFLENRKVRV